MLCVFQRQKCYLSSYNLDTWGTHKLSFRIPLCHILTLIWLLCICLYGNKNAFEFVFFHILCMFPRSIRLKAFRAVPHCWVCIKCFFFASMMPSFNVPGWRLCFQAIRSLFWKSLLANMNFIGQGFFLSNPAPGAVKNQDDSRHGTDQNCLECLNPIMVVRCKHTDAWTWKTFLNTAIINAFYWIKIVVSWIKYHRSASLNINIQ